MEQNNRLVSVILLSAFFCAAMQVKASDSSGANNHGLRARVLRETAVPVRLGVPGKQPFWNRRGVQFLYAPAFEFNEVPGAGSYRFTIETSEVKQIGFTETKPWAVLSSVWTNVPVGKATLTVVGLDAAGGAVGTPQIRQFHRAAPFTGVYAQPKMTWRESASLALGALVHSPELKCWFTTGQPDPNVHLYRYPAKIVGAAAAALALYGGQTPPPADAPEALDAARRAADHLLSICYSESAQWAFHAPTYHPTLYQDKLRGHMKAGHYMTQYGAEAGQNFLDVYTATKDAKYLQAAVRIAETYEKNQLPEGSWPLFVSPQDGKPVANNLLIPMPVVEFLDRLDRTAGDARFRMVREKALAWVEANPVRTWNWQAQFEDVKPLPPYDNLTQHDASSYAIHLLRTSPQNPEKRELALDLLRFGEDQFVMWDQPPADKPSRQNDDGTVNSGSSGWLLPCVVEQYCCFAPVARCSAKMISAYLAVFEATGDTLYLEKAKALASSLIRTQSNGRAPGRYQTWVSKNSEGTMWFNNELAVILAINELADCTKPKQ